MCCSYGKKTKPSLVINDNEIFHIASGVKSDDYVGHAIRSDVFLLQNHITECLRLVFMKFFKVKVANYLPKCANTILSHQSIEQKSNILLYFIFC